MFHICARSISMALVFSAAPWQAAMADAPFAREVPTTYPRFEKGAGSVSLVVAELVATDYLKGYDCPKPPKSEPNADGSVTVSICFNPPPTWFKARVLQHVAGADIGDEFYAVTGSHYGAMKVGAAEPARLMLLRSNGSALDMLRYRSWPVTKARDGQYYLILRSGPIAWLPCGTTSLMQEIDDGEFAADLAITRAGYDSRLAQLYAAYYRVSADSARPRYAISVARLQQALKDVPPAASGFACAQPDPVR